MRYDTYLQKTIIIKKNTQNLNEGRIMILDTLNKRP